MKPGSALWVRWWAALVLATCGLVAITAQQSSPSFRAGVELFTIKVQVAAARGKALPGLTPGQFDVRINGRRRSAVFAELIRYDDVGARAVRVPPRANETNFVGDDDDFFQSFPNQASALYLLGVETTATERRGKVGVKVSQKDVTVRRWAWCVLPAKCTHPDVQVSVSRHGAMPGTTAATVRRRRG